MSEERSRRDWRSRKIGLEEAGWKNWDRHRAGMRAGGMGRGQRIKKGPRRHHEGIFDFYNVAPSLGLCLSATREAVVPHLGVGALGWTHRPSAMGWPGRYIRWSEMVRMGCHREWELGERGERR